MPTMLMPIRRCISPLILPFKILGKGLKMNQEAYVDELIFRASLVADQLAKANARIAELEEENTHTWYIEFREASRRATAAEAKVKMLVEALEHAVYRTHPALPTGCSGCETVGKALRQAGEERSHE